MKKKILFVLPTFEIGGTVVSTKNLILLLDKNEYDITVLCMNGKGSLRHLYKDINQIHTSFVLSALTNSSYKDYDNIFKILYAGIIRKLSRFVSIKNILLNSEAKKLISNKYEMVVACQEGFCTDFVSRSKIEKKTAWIRCDYSRYLEMIKKTEKHIYEKYSNIICVSELISKKFIQIYPDFINKVHAINNPQSSEFIITQSNTNEYDSRFINDKFTIISVGRFDPIKRFCLIPKIASFLVKHNMSFKWYIIGDGNENEKMNLINRIREENVEKHVILLGKKTNPHYYIKHSNLVVVLSSSEACPRIINEAKILHTPVISTDFDTAKEYINNEYDGIISSIENIENNILEIITNPTKYNTIKSNISNFSFDNIQIMKQLKQIFQ